MILVVLIYLGKVESEYTLGLRSDIGIELATLNYYTVFENRPFNCNIA